MGWGLRAKWHHATQEARYLWSNTFACPRLYQLGTAERFGAVFKEPSDMSVPDRIMLYALTRGLRPLRVLEIGARWGGSARIITAAMEDGGGPGRLVGIDPLPDAFRAKPRELHGRYQLIRGYSPGAIPEAVDFLGGPLDFVLIDAMHTHDHVLADFQGVIPHLAHGAHVLLHDSFHQGIHQAVLEIMAEHPDFVDCGFLTRFPEISDAPVAYQGLRMVRAGSPDGREVIAEAFRRESRPVPTFDPELWNWDHYWNRVKGVPSEV